jgi:hypothetical protein
MDSLAPITPADGDEQLLAENRTETADVCSDSFYKKAHNIKDTAEFVGCDLPLFNKRWQTWRADY